MQNEEVKSSLWLYSEDNEYIQQIRNGRQSTLRTIVEGL